jgi:putative transposase
MAANKSMGRRRSIRIPEFDYSLAGGYFITICTQNKETYFGKISDGIVQCNKAGQMIDKWW